MSLVNTQVAEFIAACKEYGFVFEARGTIVTIRRNFIPSTATYGQTEMASSIVLGYVPAKGGSTWGSDGGSIGGAMAMQTGRFVMNVSGVSKRFINALKKIPYTY